MDKALFENFMNKISDAHKAKDYKKCLQLTKELKEALNEHQPINPIHLGWQRFYHFVSLVELHQDFDALTFFLAGEEHPFSHSYEQISYMTSVSAELACNLKKRRFNS